MEEMVPELEDLEEKGYFTRAEIRDIVRKREKFEYALKRKTPAKADFLRSATLSADHTTSKLYLEQPFGLSVPQQRA